MTGHAAPGLSRGRKARGLSFVLIGLALMAGLMLMPTPAGLSLAGQRLPLAVVMYGLILVCMFVYWPFVGIWG